MKRNIRSLLCLALALVLLAGCGGETPMDTAAVENVMDTQPVAEVEENRFTFPTPPTVGINYPVDEPETVDTGDVVKHYDLVTGKRTVKSDTGDMEYVLIYNPGIYHQRYGSRNLKRTTGSLESQIDVNFDKSAPELETLDYLWVSQEELNGDLPQLQEGDRAGAPSPVYKVGDKQYFFCYDDVDLSNSRIYREFTCRYAGTHCNIWVNGEMEESVIRDYGARFDNDIYDTVVEAFGQPRYAETGGKVNLLYYSMPEYIGGCFCMLDLYASNEVTVDQIFSYGVNTDHAILHINLDYSAIASMQTFMRSTMAHEFQHLICGTNAFYTRKFTTCESWLNEAMSGYIEEQLFPGMKAGVGGHLPTYAASELIRGGQSMYNFTTSGRDIGVYGGVYLYAEYLADLIGRDVFSNVHAYWRNSYSATLCDSEALASACPKNIYDTIQQSITYPSSIILLSDQEIWMSKLTLHFYLDLLERDGDEPGAFSHIDGRALLYDQLAPTDLEGGGRVLVALKGDTYTIPTDAATGLIYVGLDKDFHVVTDLYYK